VTKIVLAFAESEFGINNNHND